MEDLDAGPAVPRRLRAHRLGNDLHLPDPHYNKGFEGDAFISRAEHGDFPAYKDNRPFWIPYRCLYSRNIDNLFMAGRCISVTHEALGAVRVMRTCGTQGEIVGMAASVCKEHDTDPRGVYEKHLADLQDLMRRGVGRNPGATMAYANRRGTAPASGQRRAPDGSGRPATNLARAATVERPAPPDTGVDRTVLLNDGNGKVRTTAAAGSAAGALPHIVEFRWDEPVELGAARIISGYNQGGRWRLRCATFRCSFLIGGNGRRPVPGRRATRIPVGRRGSIRCGRRGCGSW